MKTGKLKTFTAISAILLFQVLVGLGCYSNSGSQRTIDTLTVVAVEDSFDIQAGASLDIPAAGLTSNDVTGNNPPLTVTGVSGAVGGEVVLQNSVVTFTSTGNVGEAASFFYDVANAAGVSAQGTVTLNVTGTSDTGDSGETLTAANDTWTVYAGKSTSIPTANLTSNDIDLTDNYPVTVKEVGSAAGGTVSFDSSAAVITFTSTGPAGADASFVYVAENSTGLTDEATVVITVEEAPSVIANADTFSVVQGESCYILTSNLISNDEADGTISLTEIGDPVGGTVTRNGDNITFSSTGYAYSPAGFSYTIEDGIGSTATGSVYINVTPLASIEAYIYDNTADLNLMKDSYVPPTVQDIFDTWGRFNGNNYFADRSSAEDAGDYNATAWEFLTDPDRVSMPLNVSPYNGFVSNDSLENYTMEVTLSSTSSDNDTVGLVIAFAREGSTNYILSALRTQGGTEPDSGWGVTYGTGVTGSVYSNTEWILSEKAVGSVSGSWSGKKSRVKIVRTGDIIKCYTTEWDDVNNYQASSEIVIDLTSDERLERFRGAMPYGYSTFSQPDSTFLDIDFSGGINVNKLYDATTGEVWEYVQGSGWTLLDTTIQQDLGFVREVSNPDTGKTFLIKENSIESVE